MTIKETLNISLESVLNREYNLWIGYSLDNKWFTQKNLIDLIELGLMYSKESLLIEIPGRLQATNLRYFEKLSRANALKTAFDVEKEKIKEIENIIKNFTDEDSKRIIVANYDDILTPKFIKQREILMREFSEQGNLYQFIIEISDEMLKSRDRTISKERSESVALYILEELPFFLDGIQKIGTDQVHTVVLYPGFGKLDELVMKILNDDDFESLRDRLHITHKIGIASVM